MKYMGSKRRIAKYILPIMLNGRLKNQYYVEPFAGGMNTIDKVIGLRIANDNHFYLIELFLALGGGWIPPEEVTLTLYNNIRKDKENYPPHLVGFVGFCCTYGGKWFGGYARGNTSKGLPRNYCLEGKNNLLKQIPNLKDCIILNKHYTDFFIPAKSIIYCDPPYSNTTNYVCAHGFNNAKFYDWCRVLHLQGHTIYVSGYTAPEDFICIWEKTLASSLRKTMGSKKSLEKLFTLGERD